MLIDISIAPPPYKVTQKIATEELKKRMSVRPAIGRLIDAASAHSGIETRHLVIPDGDISSNGKFYSKNDEYIKPDTQTRMKEYEKWAKELTKKAAKELIEKNNINPEVIDRLITISCTGFFAPGLDYYLIEELNLSRKIKRTNIGFMGCAAAITGFNSILENMKSANNENSTALLISVELCSLHLQTEATRDNILANMIFADGCAAALFSNSKRVKPKFDLIHTSTFLFDKSSEFMGWNIGNFGFEMILSSDLPKIILEQAAPKLIEMIEEAGIEKGKIKYWALHPGGRAILDSLQKGLNLSDEQLLPSRNVLKNFGNMSSASILYVMNKIISEDESFKDEYLCAVAFGPGLTMEMAVFKGM